jgi:Flp pilus assembly protein TadB
VNTAILILVILALSTALAVFLKATAANSTRDPAVDASWQAAVANERSQIGRILLRVSRPMANIPQIYEAHHSQMYRALYNRIMASGTYGGSLEVYLAVQAMCAFIGATCLVGAVLSGQTGLTLTVVAVLGVGVTAFPYNVVAKKAKDRLGAVEEELPVFAELLLMPLESGMTPMAALAFTAERLNGPVAEEVRNLRTVINSRAMSEPEAFRLAAARLGTAEASAFFTALMQAHLEGAKVIRNLQAQAESLRVAAHQKRRAAMKRLPMKIVLIMAAHMLPVLFVAALLPTFASMAQI